MNLKKRNELEQLFQAGARPSAQDFKDLIASTLNKRDDQFLGRWEAGAAYVKGDVVIYQRTVWELDGEKICSTEQDPPSLSNKDWLPLLVPAADEDWVLVDQQAQSGSPSEGGGSDEGDEPDDPTSMHANPRVTRVGIGTSEPTALLDLHASERTRLLLGGSDQDNCPLRLVNLSPASGLRQLAIGVSQDAAVLVTDSDRGFLFRTRSKSSSDADNNIPDRGKIRLDVPSDDEARLGVGRQPEDYHLDVHGLSRLHGFYIDTDQGNLSEQSLLGSVLDKLAELQPKTFKWAATTGLETNGEQIGLVAQDVAVQFPQAVKAAGDDTFAVSEHALVAVLVKAVQEQQEHIQQLKTRLDALEQQLSDRGSTPAS